MTVLMCPAGRRYRVTSAKGVRLAVVDESDGFRFSFSLNRTRLERGWRIESPDDAKPAQTQRDRSPRRANRPNQKKATRHAI